MWHIGDSTQLSRACTTNHFWSIGQALECNNFICRLEEKWSDCVVWNSYNTTSIKSSLAQQGRTDWVITPLIPFVGDRFLLFGSYFRYLDQILSTVGTLLVWRTIICTYFGVFICINQSVAERVLCSFCCEEYLYHLGLTPTSWARTATT